ncbi:MAG: SDR family NAD(P)-dependent oxidoreductase, partial [Pseudomonadales bacterium]|nr:SDR family NAD(P)-dependent oxidoreductase [Pseudomonadales bacterium]
MTISFEGKVAIGTGAGNGLGRQHALELARRGAKVVVNDLGGAVDGSGGSSKAAEAVVAEIRAFGGTAIANGGSVSDKAGAKSMVDDAVKHFGTVHILINNAGILRD